MAASAGAELGCFFGRLTVRGSRNSRAGERFSVVAALVASSVGVFAGGMAPVASCTCPACASWPVNLDTVSFNSSIKTHPTRPSPEATTIETSANRAQTCNASPPLIRATGGIRSFAGKRSVAGEARCGGAVGSEYREGSICRLNCRPKFCGFSKSLFYLVGVAGFEPATPSSRTRCATRLLLTT
jgi:hypothetical protein